MRLYLRPARGRQAASLVAGEAREEKVAAAQALLERELVCVGVTGAGVAPARNTKSTDFVKIIFIGSGSWSASA